jgi:hypothetical protein
MSEKTPDELEGIVYVGEDGAPEEVTPESLDAHLEGKVEPMGPRQRPGPNDESLPPLMTAADLLPEENDPLAALPQEPPDSETPPDSATPPFIVQRDKFGPRSHGVYLPDGMPVGIWLDQAHHDLDGVEVAELLAEMGLEADLAIWYGEQRNGRIAAEAQLTQHPTLQRGAAQEDVRLAQKKAVQEAFIKAQKAKKA